MNPLITFFSAILAGYGAFELFIMAKNADKERRICVILQIASGFGLCLWVIFDKNLITMPTLLALLFIAMDRLQTRMNLRKTN